MGLVSEGYLGRDALQKLKLHYHVNKVGSLHMLARVCTLEPVTICTHTHGPLYLQLYISSGITDKLFLVYTVAYRELHII